MRFELSQANDEAGRGSLLVSASLAVAILLALTVPANAQNSANEMLSGCKGLIGDKTPPLREALRQGRCAGYVAGLVYARSVFLCVPEGAAPEQGVRVVIKDIEARPERTHEPFGKLALEALEEAWPVSASDGRHP
jgi:Rap1a immunity proteins